MELINAVAIVLQVSENQISSIEEWAKVYFVRFSVGRPTFVSKSKVNSFMEISPEVAYQKAVELGCRFQPSSWSPANPSGIRIILKRETEEQLAILKSYGFDNMGCFEVNPEPPAPILTLEEQYEKAVQYADWGMGVKIEKLQEFKAAGFDLNRLGYGHI